MLHAFTVFIIIRYSIPDGCMPICPLNVSDFSDVSAAGCLYLSSIAVF